MQSSQPVLCSLSRPPAPRLPPRSEPTPHHLSCHSPCDTDGKPDHFLNRSRSLHSCASGASALYLLPMDLSEVVMRDSRLSGCVLRRKLALP